jgi:Asp/Glu/hydantoin racemase
VTAEPVRILWQSFLDPEDAHKPYVDLVRRRLAEIADPGVTFDIVGILPPDRHIHRLTELRCGLVTLRNALAADRGGYDAIAISHFQEPLLGDIRSAVDIPVVSIGEASLLYACTLGQKIGLVTIDPAFVPWHEEQLLKHGLERRVVGVTAMQISPAEFMSALEPGAGLENVIRQFEEQAQPLLAAGAEVLIPAGALPSMALARQPNLTIGGARVLDIVAIGVAWAEAAVKLRRVTGVEASRRSAFAKPSPEALDDFIAETGGPLRELV